MTTIAVPIRDLTRKITLTVTGLQGFGVRLRIAGWLFRLGAWVAGVGIVIER
jgi:hypothetical protein